MNNDKVQFTKANDRERMLPFLKLADDSENMIRDYIQEGELYEIVVDDQTVGIILFTFTARDIVEIKNMALVNSMRRKGMGREVIKRFSEHYKKSGYSYMIVGTANSSIGNLAFYQKAGFRFDHIKRDFFFPMKNQS